MNRKPLIVLLLLRSQIISCGKIFLPLAAVHLANASVLAQDANVMPANPAPAITFRVLRQRIVESGDQSVILNRVALPVLPHELATPVPARRKLPVPKKWTVKIYEEFDEATSASLILSVRESGIGNADR